MEMVAPKVLQEKVEPISRTCWLKVCTWKQVWFTYVFGPSLEKGEEEREKTHEKRMEWAVQHTYAAATSLQVSPNPVALL